MLSPALLRFSMGLHERQPRCSTFEQLLLPFTTPPRGPCDGCCAYRSPRASFVSSVSLLRRSFYNVHRSDSGDTNVAACSVGDILSGLGAWPECVGICDPTSRRCLNMSIEGGHRAARSRARCGPAAVARVRPRPPLLPPPPQSPTSSLTRATPPRWRI
jgi:hypothetical protein